MPDPAAQPLYWPDHLPAEQEFMATYMRFAEQWRDLSAEVAAARERWERRYAEGRAAYARGLTRQDCPHPLYTHDREGWLHGFATCLPPGPVFYSGPAPTRTCGNVLRALRGKGGETNALL